VAVEIREARPEELDEAAEVMVAAYEEYRPQLPQGLWDGYARDIRNVRGRLAESRLILLLDDGDIAGAVTYYPPDDAGLARIRLLAVNPSARGKGLARMLMDECIRRARKAGAKALGLHTTPMMAVARGMYERMGFLRHPQQDMEVAPNVTVMAYVLDLGV
jgi:ribosomal protein S18 acetylase RimI-like enzyme